MKIRNFCWSLKNKQINYYLSKLPNIYRTCSVPILFLPANILGYFIWRFYAWKYNLEYRSFKEFSEVGGTSYYYHNTHEPIMIYIKHSHELTTPFILFHELRHWYQQMYLKGFRKMVIQNYNPDINFDRYHLQPIEKDANTFAKNQCKKIGIKFMQSHKDEYTIDSKRTKLIKL